MAQSSILAVNEDNHLYSLLAKVKSLKYASLLVFDGYIISVVGLGPRPFRYGTLSLYYNLCASAKDALSAVHRRIKDTNDPSTSRY